MEEAILKTLIYGDIFDYPLKAWEIHKWLIGKKASLRQVEKALKIQSLRFRVQNKKNYYFLTGKEKLVGKRLLKEKYSSKYLKQIKIIAWIFKIIPWVKLVGISGSLSMENSSKLDDIDLVIITSKKRLWVCRISLLILLNTIGKRRKKDENKKEAAGKICINLLLEEDNLAQSSKDIYIAHEILQMKVLWQRDNIYQSFLESNLWVFKFLPNWTTGKNIKYPVKDEARQRRQISNIPSKTRLAKGGKYQNKNNKAIDLLDNWVMRLQFKIMGKPKGQEKISSNGLYFHPEDYRPKILKEYYSRTKKFKRGLDK